MGKMWSPWRGCHRHSDGCKYCYIHKGDAKRSVDTNQIVKTDNFYAPIERKKNGEYKMQSGDTVYVCFASDFLIEEADQWRIECWQLIKARSDLNFLFLTKRIERFADCLPADWEEGYDNIAVGCTVENQKTADKRLPIFDKLLIKHKHIAAQPLIERIDIERYLANIEFVTVGGEQDKNARPLNYDWVLDIREQCKRTETHFYFRQLGTHFIKDGVQTVISSYMLHSQAKKANIDL